MTGMKGGGTASNEHRARHEGLHVTLCRQEAFPVGAIVGSHTQIVAPSAIPESPVRRGVITLAKVAGGW